MQRTFRNLKVLSWVLAALVVVLAACTPPEEGGNVFGLTVNVVGDGMVTSDPAGLDVGADSSDSAEFDADSDVVLTATANAGSTFTGWSGACDGAVGNTCTVNMDAAKEATATFTADTTDGPFMLTVAVTGDGTVTSDPAGIDCPGDCEEEYADGTDVTLTATAGADAFAGWGGACTGTTATCVVTMDAAKNVTATFATGGEPVEVSYQIQSDTDDAEEFTSEVNTAFPAGSVQTLSSDLDLNYDVRSGNDSGTIVGLRYAGVDIPQGATIASASLTFTPEVEGSGNVTFSIEGQLAEDAETFAYGGTGNEANFDISGRTTTAASVTWESTSTWTTATVDSPDLAAVIQEIVDQGGWASGNALAIIISSANSDEFNRRVSQAYPNSAPVLNVVYTAPAP